MSINIEILLALSLVRRQTEINFIFKFILGKWYLLNEVIKHLYRSPLCWRVVTVAMSPVAERRSTPITDY